MIIYKKFAEETIAKFKEFGITKDEIEKMIWLDISKNQIVDDDDTFVELQGGKFIALVDTGIIGEEDIYVKMVCDNRDVKCIN